MIRRYGGGGGGNRQMPGSSPEMPTLLTQKIGHLITVKRKSDFGDIKIGFSQKALRQSFQNIRNFFHLRILAQRHDSNSYILAIGTWSAWRSPEWRATDACGKIGSAARGVPFERGHVAKLPGVTGDSVRRLSLGCSYSKLAAYRLCII